MQQLFKTDQIKQRQKTDCTKVPCSCNRIAYIHREKPQIMARATNKQSSAENANNDTENGEGVNTIGSSNNDSIKNHSKEKDADSDSYDAFYHELVKLIKKHTDGGIHLKTKHNAKNSIIHIIGEQATPKARAIDGLEDVAELAQATAEHHPYWGLLYHSAEIANTVLDKWNDTISREEIEDIKWSIQKLEHMLDNIANSGIGATKHEH